MKKLTSAERTGLLLLAAALLVFLTVRFLSVLTREGQMEPDAVETVPELPAEVVPDISVKSPADTVAGKGKLKKRSKSAVRSEGSPESAPSGRDYLGEPIN